MSCEAKGNVQIQTCRVNQTKMDFFFEDLTLPSTSQSTPKSGREDTQMTEDTEHDSSVGKSSNMSMAESQEDHTSSSIDYISRRVQELLEKINGSRTSDQKIMDSFQEKLTEKVSETCRQMKEHMFTVYEENGNEMQVKLQELTEVLESCTKLNNELLEASQALTSLREGLTISQTSESL
ncbi:synaptonemal complex central element protein 2 isoform X2 [Seriola aureovittata]|uniref:synaptonemal complex central element protein 2 isoform X2 n=1 Tax=Seriola aureovittata TaxID=2871759 RepID=UPI0024BD8085|nr:synaptonemal complex central element protein 2 isoform X2 [Seriola aureovittata]